MRAFAEKLHGRIVDIMMGKMSELSTCQMCSAQVHELRRDRCTVCYTQWMETRPVGIGAACICCNERRRDSLKSVELLGAFVPVCFNCAGRIARLHSMPQSYAAIRKRLIRDRRGEERRGGKRDSRVFQYNRRKTERRVLNSSGIADGEFMEIDDDMIVDMHGGGVHGLRLSASESVEEMTRIHRI